MDTIDAEQRTDPAPRPARRRALRRWWLRLPLVLAVLYVAWCGVLYSLQDQIMFPADMAPPPAPLGYQGKTTIEFEHSLGPDGSVIAWFLPAPRATAAAPAPAVVYFHGNAEIIDYQQAVVEGYHGLGCSVLLPEYRGYGRCGGRPGEQAIVEDAVRFHDELLKRPEVDRDRVIIHGRSLGGGVAAQLAARRRPRALILESTFISAAAMARKYYVPSFLVKNRFRTDLVLPSLDVPAIIFHGTRDDIIPVAHGRRLRELAKDAIYVEFDCAHNDFPGEGVEDAYWEQISSFLRRTGAIEAPQP